MHHITLEQNHNAHRNEETDGFDDCYQAIVHCEGKDEARAVAMAVTEHVDGAEPDFDTEAIVTELLETMMGRALAVDEDPGEGQPRSFEHALRLLVPTEHKGLIEDAYMQAVKARGEPVATEGGDQA